MVEIAFARPEERGEIARFMQEVFPKAKWSMEGWHRLLDGRWSGPEDRYAVTARDDGQLVGVLGLVTARRPTETGLSATANMTSWYLLKPYRAGGLGGRMIRLAASDPDVTITNFSSSAAAVGAVRRAGLVALDTHRLIWHRCTARTGGMRVHRDPLALGDDLPDPDRRVLADHAGLNLTSLAVETPDGICTMAISAKRKHDAYITHDVFYLGQPEIFARHARDIADSILPPQDAVLAVDRRLLPAEVEADELSAFAVPRFYTPGRLPPAQVDLMYSELVLLDMKVY